MNRTDFQSHSSNIAQAHLDYLHLFHRIGFRFSLDFRIWLIPGFIREY